MSRPTVIARSRTVAMTMKATTNGLKNLDCGITDLGLRIGIKECLSVTWKCVLSVLKVFLAVFLNLLACP